MENLSFLRHPAATGEPPSNHRTSYHASLQRDVREANRRRREALQNRERSLSDEARDQRRLRDRHLRQNFDSHEAWAEDLRYRAGAGPTRTVQLSDVERREPYSDATPYRQHLYDWAPAGEDGDEDELEEILAELREQQPNTHPDILRVLGRNQMEARLSALEERTRRATNNAVSRGSNEEGNLVHQSSLRTAAILSSVRRNRQLSARSRDLMQRYVMDRERLDRERAGNEVSHEERERMSSSNSSGMWLRMAQQANEQHSNRYELNRLAWQANQRPSSSVGSSASAVASSGDSSNTHITRPAETLESLRRRYLDDPNPHAPNSLGHVEAFKSSIEFLDVVGNLDEDEREVDELRRLVQKSSCALPKLPRIDASTAGFLARGLPPPPCSFLRPGMVFSGFQQAAPQITTVTTASQTTQSTSQDSGTTSSINSIPLYRLPNGQGLTTGSLDPTAAAAAALRAAHAVWGGGRDGLRSQTPPSMSSHGLSHNPHTSSSTGGVSSSARLRDSHAITLSPPGQDRWAVRVHIHAVDYERMTLQGTMEAFNMPSGGGNGGGGNTQGPYPESALRSTQRSSPSTAAHRQHTPPVTSAAGPNGPGGVHTSAPPCGKTTTFSTYLTGELIDLSTHSLQTPRGGAFHACSIDDAKYWKRLAPFSTAADASGSTEKGGAHDDADASVASRVLDPRWLEEEWRDKYILMRWKERCFVKPTSISTTTSSSSTRPTFPRDDEPDGLRNVSGEREVRSRDGTAARTPSFGLSIKGFYYVSLRRSDGQLEGLYFDPQSSPYQRLEMGVERGGGLGGGAWGFV